MPKEIIGQVWDKDRQRLWDDDYVNGDKNRATQDEAEYTMTGGEKTCGTCMFYAPDTETLGRCIKVQGVIDVGGHSKYWASRVDGTGLLKERRDGDE